ncbi:MAG TPA: HlyD family efflux transporter periplasmic adaptor subunit [Gemmataceae bacterium]|nr:HlyD family efflux transporter periplasmic adaptor subunit [Gemmataceae bacterium]
MRKQLGNWALPLFAVGMLVFAIYHVVQAQQKPPKPPPPVEPARTPFARTVAGAGIVEARSQNIAVGSAMPGLVLKVWAPEELGLPARSNLMPWEALIGQFVKKGDPLFRVDDRQLTALLAYHEANLASARAQLDKLEKMPRQEELAVTKAKVDVSEAAVEIQRDLTERDAKLIASGATTDEQYRQHRLNLRMAQRQLEQAKADLALTRAGSWEPDKAIARAAVKLAEAQVQQDKTDIDRAIVRAPVDGVVLQVNVRPGEFVAPVSNQAQVVLGTITDHVNIRVDIDEHDIPRFQEGAPAVASLRGAPEKKYPLTFIRVDPYVIPKRSLTGDNTERVDTRVMQVIYALKPEGKPVYVGQQLDVFIDVGSTDKPAGPPESSGM